MQCGEEVVTSSAYNIFCGRNLQRYLISLRVFRSAGDDGIAMGVAWKLRDTVFGINQGRGIDLGNMVDAEAAISGVTLSCEGCWCGRAWWR
jgi:hypothetical protein